MKRQPKGFTLIEILIAITIIGIMTGVAMPRLKNSMAGESVRSARRNVVSHLSKARGAAASRGCRAEFNLVVGESPRVWVTACSLTGTGIDTIGLVSNLADQHGVRIAGENYSLSFAPNGVGVGGNWAKLEFIKTPSSETLVISPLGQARW